MAELLVRNVDEAVAQMLQQQAMAHGISQEEEHRRILSHALMGSTEVCKPIGIEISVHVNDCIRLFSVFSLRHPCSTGR